MAPSGADSASSNVELIAMISGVAVAGGSVGETVATTVGPAVAAGPLVAGPGVAGAPAHAASAEPRISPPANDIRIERESTARPPLVRGRHPVNASNGLKHRRAISGADSCSCGLMHAGNTTDPNSPFVPATRAGM